MVHPQPACLPTTYIPTKKNHSLSHFALMIHEYNFLDVTIYSISCFHLLALMAGAYIGTSTAALMPAPSGDANHGQYYSPLWVVAEQQPKGKIENYSIDIVLSLQLRTASIADEHYRQRG